STSVRVGASGTRVDVVRAHAEPRAPTSAESERVLVFCVADRFCALPLSAVVETMRPLPVAPIRGAHPCVLGAAIVRGEPTPAVDLARLVFDATGPVTRFLRVREAPRSVVLAVGDALGVFEASALSPTVLPALLATARPEAVEALGRIDRELVLLLRGGCTVPPSVFESLAFEARSR
ncbi:MAG: chemotaxis protein CheW, partial [Pseudomonadota bacterium]